jgi:pimeloyl-ACP methyl ester carboxylesterase
VHKEVTLADGTHIAYLEGGSGEPLVLVHGFGADKDNFTRVARWLTPHYRVIAHDVVGFGESTHLPDADYRYAVQAERVRAFVQALGLARVQLGGNSMGGGIVMSDPPYIPGPVMDVLARDRMANQDLERKVFAQIATDSVNTAVKGLPTPTLIVWGDEDRALSVGTVPVLKALLPNAQAVVMPHIGHTLMIERPQQAAEDYLRFRAALE